MNFCKNIELNYERLLTEEYSLEKLFRPADYDWPGDWEGRALLAFLCHKQIHGAEVPHLHDFFSELPRRTNDKLYFGKPFDGVTVDEQQLSGHNWYLRGLLKYSEIYGGEEAMAIAKSTVENLYLPTLKWYTHYPLERGEDAGGVSGSVTGTISGWKLSSDVGCAFMCVDGLAKYYAATKDEGVKEFLDSIIELFVSVDLCKYKLQTHTTLTCLRGILTLFVATGEERYLDIVKEKFAVYIERGMTLTYENFNWFGREDTWTEPCAVVDSFILATELYRLTDESGYKTLARRIWFNGLQFCQRANGGAGPNTCVTKGQGVLKISMYEAPFCCTMRYAEGLLEYHDNRELFSFDGEAPTVVDGLGRRFVDDRLIVKYNGKATPIFPCHDIPESEAKEIELEVIF